MPALPADFQPVMSGYSHDGPRGVVRSEVAGGAARYALDWDRGTQQFSCTLILDKVQYSVWIAFYQYSIRKGALAFDMPLDSGFGLVTHSVNIIPGSYSVAHTGGVLVTVVFKAEAQCGAYGLSSGEVATFAAAYGLTAGALPASFQPVLSGYSHDGPGGVVRSEVAGGAARYALGWDRGLQQFSCTLILATLEYRVWSVWFHRLISKGALSFDMPLDSGFGLSPHLVNIIPGSYSVTRNGHLAIVSFAVEGESQVYALGSSGAASLLELYATYGRGTSALLDRLNTFSNHDTLVLNF